MILLAPYKVNLTFKKHGQIFKNVRVWVVPQIGARLTYEDKALGFFSGKVVDCEIILSVYRQDINLTIE